jgi:hypothetical protein
MLSLFATAREEDCIVKKVLVQVQHTIKGQCDAFHLNVNKRRIIGLRTMSLLSVFMTIVTA